MIVESEPSWRIKAVVLRLGRLHTEISLLGDTGDLMSATGLPEFLETVYAENAVKAMLTGKAISRPIHCHFFVLAALQTKFICKCIQCSSSHKRR